ncbi:MAG: hypothetical protein WDM81_13590 [Rhizomicrobium sp.]
MAAAALNAAGGAIGKIKDWGLPQSHDSLKVRQAPRGEWVGYVADRLDRERMVDRDTGMRMSDDTLRKVLGEIHATISEEGWNKRTPEGRALGSAIAGRHSDSRFLIFKNADAWLEYAGRFGEADPFNTMLGHVDGMARDVAAMELFGRRRPRRCISLRRPCRSAPPSSTRSRAERRTATARARWNGGCGTPGT